MPLAIIGPAIVIVLGALVIWRAADFRMTPGRLAWPLPVYPWLFRGLGLALVAFGLFRLGKALHILPG